MKLRMEIIDQRNRARIDESPVRSITTDYAKLWADIMSTSVVQANPKVVLPKTTISVEPYELASKKVFEKAAAPEWGTKEWFYNTSIQAKERQLEYVDVFGNVKYASAFT